MRILVVDDEPDTQTLFQQRFRKELKAGRISFDFATSGEEALEHLRQRGAEILLILSDINMPGMSGLDLLKRIREAFGMVRVYMITAYDDSDKQRCAKEFGADGYMCKPIDFDELKREIFGQDATL